MKLSRQYAAGSIFQYSREVNVLSNYSGLYAYPEVLYKSGDDKDHFTNFILREVASESGVDKNDLTLTTTRSSQILAVHYKDQRIGSLMLNPNRELTTISYMEEHMIIPPDVEKYLSRIAIDNSSVIVLYPNETEYDYLVKYLKGLSIDDVIRLTDVIVKKDLEQYCMSNLYGIADAIEHLNATIIQDWESLDRSTKRRYMFTAWNNLMLAQGIFLQVCNLKDDDYIIYDILGTNETIRLLREIRRNFNQEFSSKLKIFMDIDKYATSKSISYKDAVEQLIELLPEAYVEEDFNPECVRAFNALHLLKADGISANNEYVISRIEPTPAGEML